MIEGLRHILNKDIVIPTVNADDLMHRPEQVDDDYSRHAYTFIPMGSMEDIANRLVKQVKNQKTVKGMLIAPYGYGKTSTLVFLWHRCQSQGILAIPAFYCSSLVDILRSTYAWTRYRFTQQAPGLLADLDALYQRHHASNLEERARHYAENHGISERAALSMLQQQQELGEYSFQLSAPSLLAFLQKLVLLIDQAGFSGLIIFPDEFQAFVARRESVRQTIQDLREFVWALNSSQAPLGVLISTDDTTESRIREQGHDILDRLRNDGFYVNLRSIYDQSFPPALWEKYCEAFELGDKAHIIEAPTLRAIGQIAERNDLSRGPRTVIDAFKLAIHYHERTGRNYTPMNLIDDFLEDRIRFDAEGNKIKHTTRQALSTSTVSTPERQQAIRLMAAFPRGVTQEISDHYNLTQAINDLSKHGGHGELMYRLVDGYTLYGLQLQVDSGQHIIDRIIAQYGRDYEPDERHAEAATRAFETHVLSKIFATRRGGQAIGWSALQLNESARGSRYGVTEGSFSPEYPRRKVAVQLACFAQNLIEEREEHDLQLDFLLHWDETSRGMGVGTIANIGQHTIRWNLSLRAPIEGAIPTDLSKVQEYVNPAFISPLLLLALIDFIESWEENYEQSMPELERQEATYLVGRLADRAITLLLNQGLHASWESPLKRAGAGLVEEVFTDWMRRNFPNYVTFFNHGQYQDVINQYQDAMRVFSKKEARGHTTIKMEKHELAKKFGVSSVATFENYVDTVYKPLLKKVSWERNQAELRCTLHPLEEHLLQLLHNQSKDSYIGGIVYQALSLNVLAEQSRTLGYRDEEIILAIGLLVSRDLAGISRGETNLIYIPLDTLNVETLQTRIAAEQNRLHDLPQGLIPPQQVEGLQSQIEVLARRLEQDTNEEDLDEISHQIDDLREHITAAISNQHHHFLATIRQLRGEVDDYLLMLRRARGHIEPTFQGQVQFVQHLSALRMELSCRHDNICRELESQRATLTEALERKGGDPVAEVVALQAIESKARSPITAWAQQCEAFKDQSEGLVQWREVLKQADMLFGSPGLPNHLRDSLTKDVVPSITEHLVKHRFDGLKDWEHYRKKVDEINNRFSELQTTGNKDFGLVKDAYVAFLREMRVGQSALRARYEYGAHEASYADLQDEVVEKIRRRLEEIGSEFDRINSDLIRVEYLQSLNDEQTISLQEVQQGHQQNARTFQELQDALCLPMVQDREQALPAFRDRINALDEQLTESRRKIGKLLTVNTEQTDEEEVVFSLLEGRQDSDLTQLFLSLRKQQDVSLEILLDRLRTLFRKGQIEIRVRRRAG
jgi:hypothetical protein